MSTIHKRYWLYDVYIYIYIYHTKPLKHNIAIDGLGSLRSTSMIASQGAFGRRCWCRSGVLQRQCGWIDVVWLYWRFICQTVLLQEACCKCGNQKLLSRGLFCTSMKTSRVSSLLFNDTSLRDEGEIISNLPWRRQITHATPRECPTVSGSTWKTQSNVHVLATVELF